MGNELDNKKFTSIVRRVVVRPLMVMVVIGIVSMISCFATMRYVQREVTESFHNSIQIAQNQLDSITGQLDTRVIRFWVNNAAYRVLSRCDMSQPVEDYAVFLADNATWMNDVWSEFDLVRGCYSEYENINQIQFRGNPDYAMHEYLKQYKNLDNPVYNKWQAVEVEGENYLLVVKKNNNHYVGMWMLLSDVYNELCINQDVFGAKVYLADYERNIGISEEEMEYISSHPSKRIVAESQKSDILLGVFIPKSKVFSSIPMPFYFLLAIELISICMIPMIVSWLRSRISKPIYKIDHAMQLIGEGNVDYRIPLKNGHSYDEFDRLSVRINQTMDELNEIAYSLYEAELRNQRTRINHLMSQIRPHFILNALNIIYTYDESEFDLIKKMVLYLTNYFRYIVNVRKDYVPLLDEIRHVQNYLNIQKERYQNRFDYFVEWEAETEQIYIPPLVIQSFVENCIKYGMKDGEKVIIFVLAKMEDNQLKILIADTGNGFSQDTIDSFELFKKTGEHQDNLGVGIETVMEGLSILYGDSFDINLSNALSGGAVVKITLPPKVQE